MIIFTGFTLSLSFLAENLISGNYPLWDPFTPAGVPFFQLIVGLKLLDPIIIISLFVISKFTTNSLILFNWVYFLQILTMTIGTYFFLRRFSTNLIGKLSLIPVLFLSGFFLSSFRSNGIVDPFMYLPLICHFGFKIIFENDYRIKNYLVLAVLTGLHFQAYRFVPLSLFILFFLIGLTLFHRDRLLTILSEKKNLYKGLLSLIIILLMMGPNLMIYLERDSYTYPTRKGEGLQLTYKKLIETGTFTKPDDFSSCLFPFWKPLCYWSLK